jgi:hypothetical protein
MTLKEMTCARGQLIKTIFNTFSYIFGYFSTNLRYIPVVLVNFYFSFLFLMTNGVTTITNFKDKLDFPTNNVVLFKIKF